MEIVRSRPILESAEPRSDGMGHAVNASVLSSHNACLDDMAVYAGASSPEVQNLTEKRKSQSGVVGELDLCRLIVTLISLCRRGGSVDDSLEVWRCVLQYLRVDPNPCGFLTCHKNQIPVGSDCDSLWCRSSCIELICLSLDAIWCRRIRV